MSEDLMNPPKAAIMAGYNMMKAREGALSPGGYYQPYLSHAINCAVQASEEVVANTDRHYFDLAAGLKILHEAADVLGDPNTTYHGWHAAANKIGRAHQYFAKQMKQAGYREITAEDFKEFGSGGGR